MIGLLLWLHLVFTSSNEAQNSSDHSSIIEMDSMPDFDGGIELLNLVDTVPLPSVSCYTEVLFSLDTDCVETTDDELKKISLRLTKCYFNITGRLEQFPYHFPEEHQTGEMSAQVYAIYTTMKLHWRNICMFMKQLVFTEEASRSLVDLLDGMIKETASLRRLQQQLEDMSERLNQSVTDVRTQFSKVVKELDILLNISGFDTTVVAIFEYINQAIQILEHAKFYLSIGVTVSVISLFLPGFVGPITFATIVAIWIDKYILPKLGLTHAVFRGMFKATYVIFCCGFPVMKIVKMFRTHQH